MVKTLPEPPRPGLYLHMAGQTFRVTAVRNGQVEYHCLGRPDEPLCRPLVEFEFPGRYTRVGD